MTSGLTIRPLQRDDFARWKPLWDGYNAFYKRVGPTALPLEVTETTWARFFDAYEAMHGLIAERSGRLLGLVHFLFHRSTSQVAPSCYLQDLFTAEEARGKGIGRALIDAVYRHASAAGVPRVYWHTHETNAVAMRLYDTLAEKSGFVVYRKTLDVPADRLLARPRSKRAVAKRSVEAVAAPFIVDARQLAAIAGRTTPLMADLVDWMNRTCPLYGIDSAHEYAHFLAQACHETDHFKTLREYASGRAYEGRADLGNTQPGDGVRFKGRGVFQTTGRANYLQLGVRRGERDLFVDHPELLEQPEHAVWSACEYWRVRGLDDIASHADTDVLKKKVRGKVVDVSPVEFIGITINGGYNGMDERKKFYASARSVLIDAPAAAATTAATDRSAPRGKRTGKRPRASPAT